MWKARPTLLLLVAGLCGANEERFRGRGARLLTWHNCYCIVSIVGHNALNAEGTTATRPLSAIPPFAGVDACNNFISCYVGHVRFRFRRK